MSKRWLALLLLSLLLSPALAHAQGTCSIYKSFQTGDTVSASDLNSIQSVTTQTNMEFSCLDDYSTNATEMQTTTDPNNAGSASLATTGAGELERLRYTIAHAFGFNVSGQWWQHYQNVNFRHRMVQNHFTTLTGFQQMFRGEAHLSAAATRFHLVGISVTEYVPGAAHPESMLFLAHVNGTLRFGVGIGGDTHVGGVLTVHAAGTVAYPSINFNGDSLTGLSRPAAHTVALSRAGTETARFDAAGRLGLGVSNPLNTLHVAGAGLIRDSLHVGSAVAIGVSAPTATLHVAGTAAVTDRLTAGNLHVGASQALFQGGAGFQSAVAIGGIATPTATLHVAGTAAVTDRLTAGNLHVGASQALFQGGAGFQSAVAIGGIATPTATLHVVGTLATYGVATFGTTVGINTTTPTATLHVTGTTQLYGQVIVGGPVLLGTTVTTGTTAAGEVVLADGNSVRWVNNAGATSDSYQVRGVGDSFMFGVPTAGTGSSYNFQWGGGTYLQYRFQNAGVAIEFLTESSADHDAPGANRVRIYAKDNGSGKTQLCARFNTGAVQCFATEP